MPSKNVSRLYEQSSKVPFASRLSMQVRQGIFELFMDVMQPTVSHTVLDVGVTNDEKHLESNFFEKLYPHKSQIVCVGTEDGKYLEERYVGIRFQQVFSGNPLPFDDNSFDFVFSNAVIEHVGDVTAQRFFISEICRVGKNVFVTTPNRWFPVEHHTGIPLLHYLPKLVHRKILRSTVYDYWSYEENLNIMDMQAFKRVFPPHIELTHKYVGILNSNMVIYAHTES